MRRQTVLPDWLRKFANGAALLFALMISLNSYAGNEGANAGDEVGLAFESAYMTAVQDIAAHHPDLYAKIQPTALESKLDQIQVLVVENELYVDVNGQKQISAAVNDSSKLLILLNRFRWNLMRDSLIQRSLALHEVLSLFGLENTGRYPISSVYYGRISNRSAATSFIEFNFAPPFQIDPKEIQ